MLKELDTSEWAATFGENDCVGRTIDIEAAKPGSGVSLAMPTREDVVEIAHFRDSDPEHPADNMGDWDGQMVARLRDGRWVAVTSFHDYSGWG